jgi:radical SAM superfamily enzyme YgiQ (UPF0313 family)
MTKRILLISPMHKGSFLNDVALMRFPPISLAIIKALTPEGYEVDVFDESFSKGSFSYDYDLVGITAMTATATRAYAIAVDFRKRGVPVVLGGIHVSMVPEEASAFADSVFIGEVENGGWIELLRDFENGSLKRFYNGGIADVSKVPIVHNSVKSLVVGGSIQTARGCPINCEFCSVSVFNGQKYRGRPVDDVMTELRSFRGRNVMFLDDNIVGHGVGPERRALELFQQMTKERLRMRWASQASINLADNEALLKAASEAGALGFFVGFESLDPVVLKKMGKGVNLNSMIEGYAKKIKKFHDHGLTVYGGFILGNLGESAGVFERTRDFVMSSGLDGAQYTLSTPIPGTRLWKEITGKDLLLKKDFPNDWDYFDGVHSVYKHDSLSPQELERGILNLYRSTNSLSKSIRRAFTTFSNTRQLPTSAFLAMTNFRYYTGVKRMLA